MRRLLWYYSDMASNEQVEACVERGDCYWAFLLRIWREGGEDSNPRWMLSLQDALEEERARVGFDSLVDLIAYLEMELRFAGIDRSKP